MRGERPRLTGDSFCAKLTGWTSSKSSSRCWSAAPRSPQWPGARRAVPRARRLAGAALALIPARRTLVLDPELALALFVAPVLLDAAFDSSPRDLRANWRPSRASPSARSRSPSSVVAVVAHTLVPGHALGGAIALGAIVAPPDAAAATAVLKQLRPPHRLLVISRARACSTTRARCSSIGSRSAPTVTGVLSGWSVVPTLLVRHARQRRARRSCSRASRSFVNSRISDVATAVMVQFCGTFVVWILAERLHLSGIITMVVFAMAGVAPRVRGHPGAHPHPIIGSVGSRGVRAERARVHPRGLPAQVDPGTLTGATGARTPWSRRPCASR